MMHTKEVEDAVSLGDVRNLDIACTAEGLCSNGDALLAMDILLGSFWRSSRRIFHDPCQNQHRSYSYICKPIPHSSGVACYKYVPDFCHPRRTLITHISPESPWMFNLIPSPALEIKFHFLSVCI